MRQLTHLRTDPPVGFAAQVLRAAGVPVGDDRVVLVEGPVGQVFVAYNDAGICHVAAAAVVDGDPDRFADRHRRRFGREVWPANEPPPGLLPALRTGRGSDLAYDLTSVSAFARAVLRAALLIPPGEVRSYGWVAREIGTPAATRAVGSALGRNPVPILVPCHRVVRSDGRIGDYAFGSAMKRNLLQLEGVPAATPQRWESADR